MTVIYRSAKLQSSIGHWHTSWARAYFEGKDEFGSNADFSTYYGNGYIGLDAMTAHTGKINVLVVEDNMI